MKAITFKQFMTTYNFRLYRSDCESENNKLNSSTIRIRYNFSENYTQFDWFEFGIYDYAGNNYKLKQINEIFSKRILEMYVCDFYYDDDLGVFVMTLSDEKHISEVCDE